MKRHDKLLKMIWAAMFLALAYVLPFLTGQIPQIGAMLLPMHIPVLLCGFICGWPWGLAVGFLAPLLRSAMLGMPVMFPKAVCMAFELAAYGAVAGFLYRIFPKKKRFVYCALLGAMILGRIVWGIAMSLCMGITGNPFGFSAFLAGAVTNAVPGIIIQIILIPVLIIALEKNRKIQTI
ncbi:MAG: ECF transporter S component [Lachnospiraceae bacterium]|nr:ECF transporter S component [Lachnospiraceae bacterium]